jgi:putrescine importer
MPAPRSGPAEKDPRLSRALGLWDLVFYGIVLIQPTAPMPLFGVVDQEARGHVVTAILIAMAAMLLTAMSYGRMARAYPSSGSAYTYTGRELHPALGYVTGWSMAMDYMLNPIICVIWCSKAACNVAPAVPYGAWAVMFALLFTGLNLRGIRASARTNEAIAIGLGIVVAVFLAAAARSIFGAQTKGAAFFIRPFYDPATFAAPRLFTGASIAVLTYIGFDGISTLSEEVRDPRRNIPRATVLVCLITGILAAVEVYAAQLVWPAGKRFPDVDTAFSWVAGQAGGAMLFQLVNFALLAANLGSGVGAQLGLARLLYGMGREDALPRRFFGALDPKRRIPRNNVLFTGALTLIGALALSYQLGAEMLNFGAFVAFMGVNAAAFVRARRDGDRRWRSLALPLGGLVICFWIWLNLRWPAKLAGTAWLVAGVLYGAWKMRGFRKVLTFDGITE